MLDMLIRRMERSACEVLGHDWAISWWEDHLGQHRTFCARCGADKDD